MNTIESPNPPQHFRRLLRWLLRALVVVLVLLVIAGGYLALRHWRAVNQLSEAIAQEDANYPSWRLEDIEAARPNIPDDDNGMLVVHRTAQLLPQHWPPQDSEFPGPDNDVPPNTKLAPEKRARLSAALENWSAARLAARQLTARSSGRAHVAWARDPLATPLPHVVEARNVTMLLTYEARTRMEEGELREAALLCRAAINAGRSIGDESAPISQLVRCACVISAGKSIERLLGQGEPDEADLTALQRMLDEEARHPGLLLGYRGWRGMVHAVFVVLQNGEFVLVPDAVLRPPTWSERWYMLPHRDTQRWREVEALAMLNKLVEIAATPVHQRAEPIQEYRAMVQAAKERVNVEAVLLVAGMDKEEAAFTRRDCYLKCLTAALAAERYRRAHGAWPPALAALARPFLATAPLDAFDAQPLRYASLKDGVVIYSLCPDAKGQVYDPDEPSPPGEGIAVRLWDVTQRKKSE